MSSSASTFNSPLIVVTSSKPPPATASSSSSSTSCAAVIDPLSGSILPSLRTGAGIGLGSLRRYPKNSKLSSSTIPAASGLDVYYAHGNGGGDGAALGRGRSAKDENVYLFGHRHSSAGTGDKAMSSGLGQRWRTKPPEPITSNICVSPCGTFIIAGTKSGRCYVWNALGSSGSSGSGNGSGSGTTNSSATNNTSSVSTGGELLRIWTAHNRPVTCLEMSSDGSLVLTAGQDGIVNAFALLDVVSSSSGGEGNAVENRFDDSIRPVRTFSEHHLPVQAMTPLPSNRLASVSSDRQVILMELCSGATLARILLPTSVKSVATDGNGRRIYAGGDDGVVYCIDLDVVAIKETAESATIVGIGASSGGGNRNKSSMPSQLSLSGSRLGETILGMKRRPNDTGGAGGTGGSSTGVSELKGHSRSVTALAVVDSSRYDSVGGRGVLVSGSNDGTLRVWDLLTRACTRVVQPWGSSVVASASASSASSSSSAVSSGCPVSSIVVVPRELERTTPASNPFGIGSPAAHNRSRASGNTESILDLFRPLQRFSDRPRGDVVPVLKATRTLQLVRRWEGDEAECCGDIKNYVQSSQKRQRVSTSADVSVLHNDQMHKKSSAGQDAGDEDDGFLAMDADVPKKVNDTTSDETATLRRELEEAKETIKRWEKVNNKLAAKLQKARAAQS